MLKGIISDCSVNELKELRDEISTMSVYDVYSIIVEAINEKEESFDYNKKIVLADYPIPSYVLEYLSNKGIYTVYDVFESGISDDMYTDNWIEWIKTYLNMNTIDVDDIGKNK